MNIVDCRACNIQLIASRHLDSVIAASGVTVYLFARVYREQHALAEVVEDMQDKDH